MPAPHTVTLEDAKIRLDDLVERVHRGEEWLITNGDGQPVAKLAAATPDEAHADSGVSPKADHSSLFGSMPGIKLMPNFDDPLEEFEEYM